MALTPQEQALDLQGLKNLKTERELAKKLLSKVKYVDKYVDAKDKDGKVRKDTNGNVIKTIGTPSELRTLLTSIGVSTSARNEVIRKIKSASDELDKDIKMLTALTS